MRLARQRVPRHNPCAPAAAVQQLAGPGDADADGGKTGGLDDLVLRQCDGAGQAEIAGGEAQCCRQQAGPEAADAGRDQHRRQEI